MYIRGKGKSSGSNSRFCALILFMHVFKQKISAIPFSLFWEKVLQRTRNDFAHIHKLLPLNVFHRVVVVYYIEDRNDVQLIAMHRGNNHHRNTNMNNKDLVEINS